MRNPIRIVGVFSVIHFLFTSGSIAARADQAAIEQLHKMVALNSLDLEGKTPFHIRIAFQYFDLSGKAAETGTAEEWWVSADEYRIVISSPSLNEVYPAPEATVPELQSREAYLVHELLDAAVHPIPRYTTLEGLDVRAEKHSADGAALSCVVVENENANQPGRDTPRFCAEPKTSALRLRSNEYASSIARNSIGVFHDVNVALDFQISYGFLNQEQMAITGHVTALGTFDPAKTPVVLGAHLPDRVDRDGIPEIFVKGKVLSQRPIKYPHFQVASHRGALVVLRGLIAKDGSVKALVVMSSPDQAFSDAAVESITNWKYKPYAIGDKPIEVYTSLYIRFVSPDQDHIPARPY